MCGIAGIYSPLLRQQNHLERVCLKMGEAISHRGPDGGGTWCDGDTGLAFAHRRLSIVDLSPAGNQPMVSSDERFVICYNGEVYNSGDIRQELVRDGVKFRGHSDTEVILESCALRGLEATVASLVGMFAFALWDRRNRLLHLVRDRLGKKPLYWCVTGNGELLFGSQIAKSSSRLSQ